MNQGSTTKSPSQDSELNRVVTFTPVVLTHGVHGCPCFCSLRSHRHIFHCCIVLGTQMLCQTRTHVGKRIP